jgi:YHS domain-containing protein
MKPLRSIWCWGVLCLVLTEVCSPSLVWAETQINIDSRGVAIGGYDPVAYFTQGKAVKGSEDFSRQWMGATWHFTSREHLEMFTTNPESYAPQYGGY